MKAKNSIENSKRCGESNNKLKEPRMELITLKYHNILEKYKNRKRRIKQRELEEFREEKREKRKRINLEGKF